MHGIYSLISGY
jgi:hypothetical protein